MANLFDHLDYRDFIKDWIASQPNNGRGWQKKIAEHLRCQGAYVSQVLNKDTQFTLEHGNQLASFIGLSSEERDFFILLIQYQRAGSADLEKYFLQKIEKAQKDRLILRNRLKEGNELSETEKAKYYSAWYYGAIRILLTIPELRTQKAITERLKLKETQVAEALAFLLHCGLVEIKNDQYFATENVLHLGNDSPLISKHHTNWRLKAVNSFEHPDESDLHFSAGITLSHNDVILIKKRLVDYIEELYAIAKPSEPETLCAVCIDMFKL